MSATLAAARKLGALVGPVMPVKGKVPTWPDWPNKATRDPQDGPEWREATGIGLVTGAKAGYFALDVDGEKGAATLRGLCGKHGELPRTWTSHTGGGGAHLFFKWPDFDVRGSAGKLGPGLDVRGTNGQVVAPPSRHFSGKHYKWAVEPWGMELATAPSWLLDLLRPKPQPAPQPTAHAPDPDLAFRRARAYLAKMDPAISGSGGHDATWKAALAVVRGFGLGPERGFDLLWSEYSPRCEPPWSEKELRHKVEGAARDASVPWGFLLDAPAMTPDRVRAEPGCDDGDEPPPHGDEEAPAGAVADKSGGAATKPDSDPNAPIITTHVLTPMSSVQAKPVRWLWKDRMAFGKITFLEGDPGNMKSTVALDIAARLSTGRPMPDEDARSCEPASVILVSLEDDEADTIKPRLIAAGADCDRIFTFRIRAGTIDLLPVLDEHMPQFKNAMIEKQAKLLILDPLSAMMGDADMHKDAEVRRVLAPLKPVLETTGAACWAIRHWNKAAGGSALHRGMGSIGLAGTARSVLCVGRNPQDQVQRILALTKNNNAEVRDIPSLKYRFEKVQLGDIETIKILWEGRSLITADELVAAQVPASPEDRSALDEAKEFLLAALKAGPMPARELEKQAKDAGIRPKTLERARNEVGAVAKQVWIDGKGCWKVALRERAYSSFDDLDDLPESEA